MTRDGHGVPTDRIGHRSGHPVPDAAGEAAARRMLSMVQGLRDDDLVIVPDLRRRLGAAVAAAPAG